MMGCAAAVAPKRTMADRSRLTSQQQQQQPNLTFGYHRRTYASTFIFELRAHNGQIVRALTNWFM